MCNTIGNDKPSIPVLEQHVFTYYDGTFAYMDMGCMPEDELRNLIMEPNPSTVTAEARSLWEDNFEKTVTTQFLKAQLQFYGKNHYPYPVMRRVLLNMLRQTLEAGKCRQVPDRVKKIEAEMRNKYEPLLENYQSNLRAWRLSEVQRQATQGSPTEMALDEGQSDSPDTEMEIRTQVSEEPVNDQVSPVTENTTLPVVERYGFRYTNGSFTSNGMGPMPEDEISALVAAIDRNTASANDPKAGDAKLYEVTTKELLEAQLRFYGIWFETTPFTRILVNLLRNGLSSGQFRSILASTKKFEDELKAEYEEKLQGTNARRA